MVSSIWQKNVEELKRHQPRLAAFLEEQKVSLDKGNGLLGPEVKETPSGFWVKGLTERPFFERKESHGQKALPKSACVFVMGCGTPSYFVKTLKAIGKSVMAVIVVEPNINLLLHLLDEVFVYKLLPPFIRLGFAVNDDDELVQELLGVTVGPLGTFAAGDLECVVHEGECEAGGGFNAVFLKLKERILINLQLIGNSVEDTLLGLRQMALVSPWVVFGPKLRHLAGAFKDRPAVVVSAGPSLDKNFELLKGREDRLIIIATDTVLRKLLKNGIQPHIVCALERGLVVFDKHFRDVVKDYKEELKDVLLVVQSVCVPQIVGTWPGPKAVIGKAGLPLDSWVVAQLLGGDVISSGASVAHMCTTLAAALGASSIALIGQDLAYGPEGLTHSKDTAWEKERSGDARVPEENRIEVPGALGGTVYTNRVWLMFIRLFEQMIPSLKESGINVYDCTEGGALIKGTDVMPLNEFLSKYADSLVPFDVTPPQVVALAAKEDMVSLAERALQKIDEGIGGFKLSLSLLDRLEKEKARVTSPGLSPAQRQKLAYEASSVIDALHAQNRVLEFLGQTYAYATLLEIIRTRELRDIEMIKRWEKAHDELIAAHRVAANFAIRWLNYAKEALSSFVNAPRNVLPFGLKPLAEEEALKHLESLLDEGKTPSGALNKPLVDNIIARCDPISADWPYKVLWKLALHLESEGRCEEGCAFIFKALKLLEDSEVKKEEAAAILKDWARLLASPDLCRLPQTEMAKVALSNALRYAPEDEEIQSMWKSLTEQEHATFSDLLQIDPENAAIKWRKRRAEVESLIACGRAFEALGEAWEMAASFSQDLPDESRAMASWCLSTIEKLTPALGEKDERIEAFLEKVKQNLGIFKELNIAVPPGLAKEIFSGFELKFEASKAE